jgi:hypothetical protein
MGLFVAMVSLRKDLSISDNQNIHGSGFSCLKNFF